MKRHIQKRLAHNWPTPLEAKVLHYVLNQGSVYGLEVVKALGIKRGSVYVILHQLEEKRLVVSQEEYDKESSSKIRRYYWATPLGQRLRGALDALGDMTSRPKLWKTLTS